MTISDLIEELKAIQAERGDLQVITKFPEGHNKYAPEPEVTLTRYIYQGAFVVFIK